MFLKNKVLPNNDADLQGLKLKGPGPFPFTLKSNFELTRQIMHFHNKLKNKNDGDVY
jgi:hypothetical protein